MTPPRFPLVATALASGLAILASMPAHAQAAPESAPAATPAPLQKLDDIQVSQQDGKIQVLVKFTAQPTAASAKSVGDALVLDVDGVLLTPFTLNPPAGNLIGHVSAEPSGDGGSLVTLTGAALNAPTAVVYRNAVLISGDLAEAKLAGSSILNGAPAKPAAPKPAVALKADAPKPEAKPAPKPAAVAEAKPIPAPPPAEKVKGLPAASLVSIDAARCGAAKAQVEKDSWAIPALGDHALCLMDAGKFPEAKNRLDQLAAFAPDDWRAAYGRAVLLVHDNKPEEAAPAFTQAAGIAPDDKTREAISRAATALAGS